MAVDCFLTIEGITGGTIDSKQPNGIKLISYSWGEENTGRLTGSGSGGGAGKVSMQDFHFSSNTSIASPLLFFACASGQHITGAVLSVRDVATESTSSTSASLVYKLSDVLVTSFSNTGPDGDTSLATDQFSLSFVKIEVDYTPQFGRAISASWNLLQNAKV
ncbi:MAG TPA: type VI secretion system tube protein Hcp [Candidatus Dormibacteraeota bacterium]|nr:type VI secretion system tube protein Hcp [Candidatus Dormibacteraeota bacterium]